VAWIGAAGIATKCIDRWNCIDGTERDELDEALITIGR
jgi:hypothetical protein